MPPQSRRQRKYESELQKLRARNRVAAILGLLTLAIAGWLVWYVWLGNKPEIFLSVNRVKNTGPQQIPFAEQSCQQVLTGFASSQLGNPGVESRNISGQEAGSIDIPEGMDGGDSFVVYFQGHFVDGKSRPSTVARQSVDTKNDSGNVFWISPETDNIESSIEDLFQQVQASPAGLKIILLDAGRYSWSPSFPGRPLNRFQDSLAEYLKRNPLKLDTNFWVIVSHSPLEVSHASSLLKSSLFSFAVSESLKSYQKNDDAEIDVRRWFNDIRQRVQSYSQDFQGRATQNPILMRAGTGMVTVTPELEELESTSERSNVTFTWNAAPEPGKEEETPSYRWDQFHQSDTGQAGNINRFVTELLSRENLTALPYETTRALEDFLERGDQSIINTWGPTAKERKKAYQAQFAKNRRPPTNKNLQYNQSALDRKHQQISEFREQLFHYLLWLRFRHQLRQLGDYALPAIDEPPPLMQVSNELLLQTSTAVDDRGLRTDTWHVHVQRFKEQNRPQFQNVLKQLEAKELTPYQAEVLGVLSQRYMPLLHATHAIADDQPKSPEQKTFELLLNSTKVATAEAGYLEDLIEQARAESNHLNAASHTGGDTEYRFFLVARGTDIVKPKDATVPHINWRPLNLSIAMTGKQPGDQYMLPTDSTRRLPFEITTSGIKALDLSIRPVTQNQNFLDSIEFGFNRKFIKTWPIRDMQPGAKPFENQDEIGLYFRCRNPDEELIGPNFEFEIIAKQWSADSGNDVLIESFPISVSLKSNAKPQLIIQRQVGKRSSNEFVGPLWQFDPNFQATNWEPAELPTLANLKSSFDVKLINNLEGDRKYQIKLYQILQAPNGIRSSEFRADRVTDEAARDYVQTLARRAYNVGAKAFEKPSEFKLLATASITAAPAKEEAIRFQAPPPIQPKPGAPEGTPRPPSPDQPTVETLNHPLLLVLYTEDQQRAEDEVIPPDWFQLVTYKIAYPGRARPEVTDYLEEVLEDELRNLPELLDASVDRDAAAQLTRVTQDGYRSNDHDVQAIRLKDLMNDTVVGIDSKTDAFLMLDLLGIPGYLKYNASSNGTNPSRFSLTGVRVKALPKDWKVHPKTWSFATDRLDDPSFDWLASTPDTPKRIFVLPKTGDNPRQKIEVELAFPTFGEDLLGSRPNDFWTKQQARFNHFFPNQRQHKISMTSSGLQAWSTVTAHTLELANIDRNDLVVGRLGNNDPVLGRWVFQMESLKRDPRITGVPEAIEIIDTAFQNTTLKFDFSRIEPPVQSTDCMVYWNGQKMDKKAVGQLLNEEAEVQPGVFEIKLEDLVKASGVAMTDLAKKKLKEQIPIEIEATDFFGHVSNHEVELNFVKPKSAIPKPKPKLGTLVIELVDAADQPANISWLGSQNQSVVDPRDALALNRQAISIRDPSKIGSALVRPSLSGSTIRLQGVPVGKYQVRVRGWIQPTGQAQKERTQGMQRITVLEEQENKLKLKLEYWDGN